MSPWRTLNDHPLDLAPVQPGHALFRQLARHHPVNWQSADNQALVDPHGRLRCGDAIR